MMIGMNTACVSLELVSHNIEFNRRMALKKCVVNVASLKNEFYNSFKCPVFDPNWKNEFESKIYDFIKEKKLRIIDENPIVTIEDGKYKIVVIYQISW